MDSATLIFILSITIQSSTAVLFATLARSLQNGAACSTSGGRMMLMGALSGFAATFYSHNLLLGVLTSLGVGGTLALIHGFFAITLRANQVVCGLALAIFGIGLSSFLGGRYRQGGRKICSVAHSFSSGYSYRRPVLFQQNPLIYLSYLLVPAALVLLYHSQPGLNLRSVERIRRLPILRHLCYRIRYRFTIFGGMLQVWAAPISPFPIPLDGRRI